MDTNVIYPITIRDLLFWFAYYELFTPKWSKHIFDEWKRVMERQGIDESEIAKRINNASKAFPNALVENYEPLIPTLKLKDEDDRHVLAAAIKTNANLIVTNNIKDFPKDYLASFGLSAKTADDFITDTIDLDNETAKKAFFKLVSYKRNPPKDEYEVLDDFRRVGLSQAANYLHALI